MTTAVAWVAVACLGIVITLVAVFVCYVIGELAHLRAAIFGDDEPGDQPTTRPIRQPPALDYRDRLLHIGEHRRGRA